MPANTLVANPPRYPATLRCIEKWFETDDCVSLLLAGADDHQFDFKPGQFVTLGVNIGDSTEYRAYSISSLPGQSWLQLTVKRVEGGKVSNYIVDQLAVGEQVECLAPAGEFNNIDCPPISVEGKRKALLISAGCGITPVFAMAQAWLAEENSGSETDITFLHIARNIEQTIYFNKLKALAANHANFNLQLLLKEAQESDYPQGRLSAEWLETLVADFKQRSVYLCGPNQFMLDTASYLEQLGYEMNHFHQESFTPTATESNQAHNANNEVDGNNDVNIELPSLGQSLQASRGTLLADALEQGGVPIIIACRSGICGSCKCKVKVGQVESSSHSPLTEEEIAQGYVLACSSTLNDDVTIEL
ncbi:hybrid-cluster NAD(P)-dependent oxidoreductase [Vibrio ponticus]|uniref:Hybrid-cluster NAD(P)-dependent oxidoreductase n=1 Tax=Vibrio ponticus TaxID=265668 RepID=A0ABX3FJC0_9VIBR|nr:hybrid-cluster NAD(P)-dependent oxidoreductase [Vibrio ponticus]OLQ94286.1 hybrid-cluster NAD(P)-dependent oxidoreductase [Vibrio ponticus]